MWSHLFKQLRKGKGTVSPEQSTAVQGGTQGTNPGAENAAETETLWNTAGALAAAARPTAEPRAGDDVAPPSPGQGLSCSAPAQSESGARRGSDPTAILSQSLCVPG